MAIPVILQGDDSGGVTIALADGHNYEGATLVVVFNGVTREFTNLTAGGEVSLAFTADETAGMPLGTGLVLMRLIGPTGAVETVSNADARIKVTDCVAEVNAGGSFSVVPGGNPLDGVEGVGTRYTNANLRAKINEIIAKLGGTVSALVLAALPCLGGALDVQTVPFGDVFNDAPVVTNVNLDVHALTNGWRFGSDVDLTEATNYTDAALGAFASTGTVARASTYGTPNRWVDATGCVWEVVTDAWIDHETGNIFRNGTSIFPSEVTDGEMRGYLTYDSNAMGYLGLEGEGWYYNGENTSGSPSTVFPGGQDATSLDNGRFTFGFTNIVGRVALTNDIPDVSGYATPADVTSAIREHSLMGIWDDKLGVWWTPHMSGGAYYWTATTNVNLAAEGN